MSIRLLIFDSHPVQYRVPIWQAIEQHKPGSIHVVYASDCTVRGHSDTDFGRTLIWDEPLLTGYNYTVLNCEKGVPLSGWKSLTGKGVKQIIDEMKPSAILLTGFNYRYDLTAYIFGRLNNIPVWLRCETQDFAVNRAKFKTIIRSAIYKTLYSGLAKGFFIGELNKQHYLHHGVKQSKLKPALYGTINRFENFTADEKKLLRKQARVSANISEDKIVVGFSGKFIDKKNPEIIYTMLGHLSKQLQKKIFLYFIGSGPLQEKLFELSKQTVEQLGIESFFAGFINQSQLAGHYLAMDILVLPSRRAGETWGLVANEAMQAGCSVVVSNAVGSGENFKDWERFRIFQEGDATDLANKITELSQFERNFEWANKLLENYSIQSSADSFIEEMYQQENN